MLSVITDILLQNTYTTEDLVSRLALLRIFYSEHLFGKKQGASVREILQDQCSEETIAVLESWLSSFEESGLTAHAVYETLDDLDKKAISIPSVTLYTPIKFPNQYIEGFAQWFRVNVQADILLVLHTDSQSSGGCGVVWDDIRHDFSLRYFVQKKKEEIITMFNKRAYGK